MLKRVNRLNKKDFSKTFEEGVVFHSNFLFLKVLPNDKNQKRFSFVVPSKIFKKAFERNKLKRQGYSIIGKRINDINNGFNFVFVLKKEFKNISFDNYEKEVLFLLKKAKLLK